MNKLYERDSYLREAETVVTKSFSNDSGNYICLEDAIFFPEEGGQHADTGTIEYEGGVVRVLAGEITGNSTCSGGGSDTQEITYKVSTLIPEGTRVKCILDWQARYDRMQNHSGEHLLTGMINKKYGFDNVGFHLSDDSPVTLDMNGMLTYEQVIEIEAMVNGLIYKNLPITDSYPTKEELKNIAYRSKIDIDGQVRLITIGNADDTADVCACCAPHVRTTGEIGILKVISVIKWKSGVQIAMLCGRRALEYINSEHDIIRETTGILSTNMVNIPGSVTSLIEETKQLKLRLAQVSENSVADSIMNAGDNAPKCVFVDGDFPAVAMKNIYNLLVEKNTGYCGIFAGNDAEGYRYYAGGSGLDARELAGLMRAGLSAKGGGSAEMIQGKTEADRESIEKFFEEL